MSRENLEKIRQSYEAVRRKEVPALLALLSPDVEIFQSPELPWGGNYQGHEEAKTFLAKLGDHVISFFDLRELIEAGDDVVGVGVSRGHVRRTGAEFEVPAVHVWRFRDGRVVRFAAYVDVPLMRHALFG